jgi:hypothetical protein
VKPVVFIDRPQLIGLTSAGKTWPSGPDLCVDCRAATYVFMYEKVPPPPPPRGWVDEPLPGL